MAAPAPRVTRGRNQLAPTSVKKPIAVSGMAMTVVSVTTRCEPWTESPMPPPITIPFIMATYGLG